MEKRNSFTFTLTAPQQDALVELLQAGNYRPVVLEHTVIAADAENCRIALYKSGKCLVQGKGAEDFVTFILEPGILQQARLGYEAVLDPSSVQPRIGVDESGKGDFFGPMVIAGAYADEALTARMREMGVKDSKQITSDKKALELADGIRKLLGNRYTLVQIGPSRYNQLYATLRNVNRMLSWGHARVIENMLEQVPDCPRAISDQFGNPEQVKRALMQRGRKIELIQRHKAESDMAVAAASILARAAFLQALHKMGTTYGVKIPKGASDAVRTVAVELARQKGPQVLLETVKCHFQTTDKVLGAIGATREALGPVGQVISRTREQPFGRHSRSDR